MNRKNTKKPFNNTLIEKIGSDVWKKILKYLPSKTQVSVELVNAFPIHNMGCKNKSLHNIKESCISYHDALKIRKYVSCQECKSSKAIYSIRCNGSLCSYCNVCIRNNLTCDTCNNIITSIKLPPANVNQGKMWHQKDILGLLTDTNYGFYLEKEYEKCYLCTINQFPVRCFSCSYGNNMQRAYYYIGDDKKIWVSRDGPNNPTILWVGLHWTGKEVNMFYACQFCIQEHKSSPALDPSLTMFLEKLV